MENPPRFTKPGHGTFINPYILRNTDDRHDPPVVWLAVDNDTRYCLSGMGFEHQTFWPPGSRVDLMNPGINATKPSSTNEVYCKEYDIETVRLPDGRIRMTMTFTPGGRGPDDTEDKGK